MTHAGASSRGLHAAAIALAILGLLAVAAAAAFETYVYQFNKGTAWPIPLSRALASTARIGSLFGGFLLGPSLVLSALAGRRSPLLLFVPAMAVCALAVAFAAWGVVERLGAGGAGVGRFALAGAFAAAGLVAGARLVRPAPSDARG